MRAGLLGALIAAAAAVAVLLPLLTRPAGIVSDTVAASASSSPADDATISESISDGCTPAAPGDYESIEEAATWVVVPDAIEQSAPAPLYVLSVAGFSGGVGELDLLESTIDALDRVVIVTAIDLADEALASLIEQVAEDFCADATRVVKGEIPSLGVRWRFELLPPPPVEPQV